MQPAHADIFDSKAFYLHRSWLCLLWSLVYGARTVTERRVKVSNAYICPFLHIRFVYTTRVETWAKASRPSLRFSPVFYSGYCCCCCYWRDTRARSLAFVTEINQSLWCARACQSVRPSVCLCVYCMWVCVSVSLYVGLRVCCGWLSVRVFVHICTQSTAHQRTNTTAHANIIKFSFSSTCIQNNLFHNGHIGFGIALIHRGEVWAPRDLYIFFFSWEKSTPFPWKTTAKKREDNRNEQKLGQRYTCRK